MTATRSPGRWHSKEDSVEQRKELAYEKHELPSRFWEPEPPEDYRVELTPEEEAELDNLPFE